jgi:small subunit ribosomal protein S3
MGQKVHPVGMRVGVNKSWLSKWYVDRKEFADVMHADIKARRYLEKRFSQAAISRIEIERPARNAKIIIYAARPGVIIGKGGKEIDLLRSELGQMLGVPVQISIEEIRKPELDARLISENITSQLLKRIAFRRAMKRAIGNAMRAGAKGIKICVSGRLGGAEIARSEWSREGRLPLQTFRADIDYSLAEAMAPYGVIGVKAWVFKGELVGEEEQGQR